MNKVLKGQGCPGFFYFWFFIVIVKITFILLVINNLKGTNIELLVNSDFNDALVGWSVSQHAGQISYTFEIKNGILLIRRVGKEPWGRVSQLVAVTPKPGQRLQLKMDIRSYFEENPAGLFEPVSVRVATVGWPKNPALRFMGLKTLAEVKHDVQHIIGDSGWQKIELNLPLDVLAQNVEIIITMSSNGELQIKQPSLTVHQE